MAYKTKYQKRLREQKCCVIVPTFNNRQTLETVITAVLEYTSDIIVVNDGSTDGSEQILESFNLLKLIHFEKNKGKGAALKAGFEAAETFGFDYAITIDSDGQHYASDIPVFLKTLETNNLKQPLLIIGERKMDQPTIPLKSSVGNKMSSFWYKVETGVKLNDTQCGYRLYPVRVINQLKLFTSRFEYEIEVIVKAAWAGVVVKNVPVKVFYDEKERITHFRPWNDTARIVVLNSSFMFKRMTNFFRKEEKLL